MSIFRSKAQGQSMGRATYDLSEVSHTIRVCRATGSASILSGVAVAELLTRNAEIWKIDIVFNSNSMFNVMHAGEIPIAIASAAGAYVWARTSTAYVGHKVTQLKEHWPRTFKALKRSNK